VRHASLVRHILKIWKKNQNAIHRVVAIFSYMLCGLWDVRESFDSSNTNDRMRHEDKIFSYRQNCDELLS
jgi:hypothetical protein